MTHFGIPNLGKIDILTFLLLGDGTVVDLNSKMEGKGGEGEIKKNKWSVQSMTGQRNGVREERETKETEITSFENKHLG